MTMKNLSREEARARAEREYADHMKSLGHTDPVNFTNMLTDLMDERKNVELRKWMNGINPRINRLFTAVTGLPAKTQKDADASLRSMDPIRWDKWLEAKRNEMQARKDQKRLEMIKKDLQLRKVEYKNKIMTMAMFYLEIMSEGYTDLREKFNGAAKCWYLCNIQTNRAVAIPRKTDHDFVAQFLADLEEHKNLTPVEVRAMFLKKVGIDIAPRVPQEENTFSPGQ